MDLIEGPAGSDMSRLDLVAAVGVGIVSVDVTGVIVSANTAATEILSCHETDLVGRNAHEALNGGSADDARELVTSARTGVATHVEDDTFRRRDRSLVPVWWSTTPLREATSGAVLGAVLVFGDATAQRNLAVADAAEREQRNAELSAAQQSVAELEWMASAAQAMSSTLDEHEVLRRLARLVAARLGDVAVADLITDDALVQRVGIAVADGVDLDVESLLQQPDISSAFERQSATYRTVTSSAAVHITVDQFDDPSVISPQSGALLTAFGAIDVLAVPMIARTRAVGLLGLARLAGSARYSAIDRMVATDICQRAALALDNARLYRAQSDISARLQRALLPSLPTALPVRAAVRYLPARDRFDVGGDWYDVFRFPEDGNTVVLVVGDVAGHDLAAGTTMSALRNLLRGVTVATAASPSRVLDSVDHNLNALNIRGTATTLVMTATPTDDGSWQLVWSNAGHLPPVLLLPAGTTEMLDEVHGTLLGTGLPQVRRQSERLVPAGSTVVLYTDGLVENRRETIDTGLTRLRRTALSLDASIDDPDAIADELLARNQAGTEDDTAMLVCHLPAVPAV
jgi:PAS domain S-box-containing protein